MKTYPEFTPNLKIVELESEFRLLIFKHFVMCVRGLYVYEKGVVEFRGVHI